MSANHSRLQGTAVCALLVALALPGSARAAPKDCTITSVGGVAFGNYLWSDRNPTDSLGTINYDCGTTALVALSAGRSGNSTQRKLTSGASSLNYNLYIDPARTQIWGDFFFGGLPQIVQGKSSLNVYGRIPPGQNVAAGAYTDTIIVTFLF
jgi:spore coat protein U-like protein